MPAPDKTRFERPAHGAVTTGRQGRRDIATSVRSTLLPHRASSCWPHNPRQPTAPKDTILTFYVAAETEILTPRTFARLPSSTHSGTSVVVVVASSPETASTRDGWLRLADPHWMAVAGVPLHVEQSLHSWHAIARSFWWTLCAHL